MVLVLTVIVLQSISFSNYALTAQTTNIIQGSAPYLTFDGGRTRETNAEALLGISLSDGRTFTPATNDSSIDNPIILPVDGQSFNDIGMFMPPTNAANFFELSSLIVPNNYWDDDDGDGQGVNGVTAIGFLWLHIVDKLDRWVTRNKVLTICKAPYKLTLSNDRLILKTRYGVPNESRYGESNTTYYINPKEMTPTICYARPNLDMNYGLSEAVWETYMGFLPQSVTPSSYGSNFPTTGANNLSFDLDIIGNNQALSWAPVSHGGITATMTDSTSTSVRVTLTGPVATPSQWESENPGEIARPSLPQVFELVGRDSSGNAVVKYGFELKQWFVNRGLYNIYTYSRVESWCNKIGYRLPKVSDLTNSRCTSGNEQSCGGAVGATPSSDVNYYRRHIGAGFFTEWGKITDYTGANFGRGGHFWTQDRNVGDSLKSYVVRASDGYVSLYNNRFDGKSGVCVYP
ncbi:hypothetical protein A9G15_02655 [Gilliamella apis]|uniref:hypothetical protein n=1 Tax=Gilliamella apis TaxID=1970738 RepID=UPI00080DB9E5|nr:hypothetical protein [Gilliamella apis]OCG04030.1 hypothetical protein A9G15_02655 [Gilliamella apis]